MSPIQGMNAAIEYVGAGGVMPVELMSKQWLEENLNESDCVLNALGRWVISQLVAERERMDKRNPEGVA